MSDLTEEQKDHIERIRKALECIVEIAKDIIERVRNALRALVRFASHVRWISEFVLFARDERMREFALFQAARRQMILVE